MRKDAAQEAQNLLWARHQAMQDALTLWTGRLNKTQERLRTLQTSPHPNTRRIAGQAWRRKSSTTACQR